MLTYPNQPISGSKE